VPLFKELNVTCIVRFNEKMYDRRVFLNAGIRHVDLFYEDGGNPTDAILSSFLQLCEQESGAIAVHCKAGLGRTGTNIAAYMIKHYGYTAKEAIAWSRVCRPGCVVGPQQQYIAVMEQKLLREGEEYRLRRHLPATSSFQAIHTGLQQIMNNNNNNNSNSSGGNSSSRTATRSARRNASASSSVSTEIDSGTPQSTAKPAPSVRKKSIDGLSLPPFARSEGTMLYCFGLCALCYSLEFYLHCFECYVCE
jgi:hypothetical protein